MKIGNKLPDDLIDMVPEGISASFADNLLFILKMEDLEDADIEAFMNSKVSIDMLELLEYEDKIGKIYAFSILIDGFIDNSEVLIDFRCDNLEDNIKSAQFVLCDEDDTILGVRDFTLSKEFSSFIFKKALEQNNFILNVEDKNTDYILLAFQKLFENEPEINLELSIWREEF
ncbi:MAG: hypothetical protein ACRC57_00330 [Sarcina sp.]